MRLLTLTPVLLFVACQSDNNLTGKKAEEAEFDEGETFDPPEDTAEEDITEDTGEDVIVDESCADDTLFLPGYGLGSTIDCEPEETTPDWTLALKWTSGALGTMISTVAMGNLTDDNGNGVIDSGDTPDVIATPYSGAIIAYDGATGVQIWRTTSSLIEQTTSAIGDLDGDGFPEVVVMGLYGSVALHGEDGSAFWTGQPPDSIKSYCGSVGIADLDGDGDPEVYSGRRIFSGQTGAVVGTGSKGHGSATSGHSPNSIAGDIDLDGQQEVIVGNAAYSKSGTAIYSSSGSDGFPAIANFDSDDEAEIVVVSQGTLRLLDTDYTEIWSVSLGSTGYPGPPAIADFNGDGEPDIAVPVAPGVMVYDGNGTKLWHWAGVSSSYFDGVSAYDLDGNDVWEVLHVGNDGLHILNGPDGTLLSTLSGAQTYCGQMPTVADVDNDGHVDVGFGTYSNGIYVMEDAANQFVAGLNIWNQHSFSITNVTAEGTIPEVPDVNWTEGYNSFRAGPPLDLVFPNKNLMAKVQAVCTDECKYDSITLTFSVGNNGTTDVTDPFPVQIWGMTDGPDVLLYETQWTAGALSGWMEDSATVEITGVPHPLYDVYITVDYGNSSEDSEVSECDETDNSSTWGNFICL